MSEVHYTDPQRPTPPDERSHVKRTNAAELPISKFDAENDVWIQIGKLRVAGKIIKPKLENGKYVYEVKYQKDGKDKKKIDVVETFAQTKLTDR